MEAAAVAAIDIDNLPASPELDALVAEKVMGWTNVRLISATDNGDPTPSWHGDPPTGGRGFPPPAYSTAIAAAWEVVDKWKSLNPDYFVGVTWNTTDPAYENYWNCALWREWKGGSFGARADTA